MKRKPFQSILTVLLGVGALGGAPCTAPLTYAAEVPTIENRASVIEDRGTTWWSVEELLTFNQEVEAEKDAECGNNLDCRMEFSFNMMEKGPKYNALANLLEGQIWVTSVNPTTETVKILFFDDDMMLKRMGIEEKINLESLFMGWSENPGLQLYNYDESHLLNTAEGHHVIYYETAETSGQGWLPAWEEVELSAAGSQLINNKLGRINYSAFADIFNAQGYFDYSSCFDAPDYQEGVECQMMVSGDQWVAYFPPREQIEPEESATEPEEPEEPSADPEILTDEPEEPSVEPKSTSEPVEDPTEESGTIIEPTIEPTEGSDDDNERLEPQIIFESDEPVINEEPELLPEEPLEQSSALDLLPEHNINLIVTATANTIKAPETGKNTTKNSEEKTIEMPWWLIVLNVLGLTFIVWWFLPSRNTKIRRKFEKKVRKNQENLLTNQSKCDKMGTV